MNDDIEIRQFKTTKDKDDVAEYDKQIIDSLNSLLRHMQLGHEVTLIASVKTEKGMETILLNNMKVGDTIHSLLTIRKELKGILERISSDMLK